MQFILLYGIGLVVFSLLDVAWVRYTARLLYRSYAGHLMGTVRVAPLVLFYLVFVLGLTFFATNPAVTAQSVWYAGVLGGLYGLVIYVSKNLESMASLRDWPVGLALADVVWGVIASAMTGLVTYGVVSSIL